MTKLSKPRVFLAMIAHETNSFSPLPTSLRAFEADLLYRPGNPITRKVAMSFPGYGDLAKVVVARGATLIEGIAAWTQPAAPATAATYEALRNSLLTDLKAAGEVSMVLLNLHGAMVAEGQDDCESDIVEHVRDLVGPDVPIGVLLDLHGNIGPGLLSAGAIVIACKEYPHIDYRARAEELFELVAIAARGEGKFRTVMKRVPVLGLFGTVEGPMRGLVDDLHKFEGKDGVRSISLMHGFPWADTAQTGASVLVVTDDSNPSGVDTALDTVSRRFVQIAVGATEPLLGVDQALSVALNMAKSAKPIIIADASDNPGGGAACDSTFLLRAMIDRRLEGVALGVLWDPQACIIAADAGPGARLQLRIGGKVGPLSGAPVDAEVEVLAVRNDAMQRGLSGALTERLGLAVALRVGGVDIVLNSIRQQTFSTECFTELGVDLQSKSFVVVKSTQHFRAAFDAISAGTVYCHAPGSLNPNIANLPYKHLTRPTWPIDPPESLGDFSGHFRALAP